jgi:hypothetical protein
MGKTRWACSAMRGYPEKWGQEAYYVPFDPGSAELSSVLLADRPYLVTHQFKNAGDPYNEITRILDEDLAKASDTIIVDTMSIASRVLLQGLANSGKFSDKHITIVDKGPGKINVAMPGDYGTAQNMVLNALRMLEATGKNLIVLFHDALWEPDATSSATPVGGPATAGKANIALVAGWFHNLIRVESRTVTEGGKQKLKYFAHTEKKGPYLAKIRQPLESNPIPEFELNPDPVNFWLKLKELGI